MQRRKWSWTQLQIDRANHVIEVVNEYRDYWPLTLRQIFYRLVSKGLIENTPSQYNMLSKLVKWMRIDEKLPWNVLEDRVRHITDRRGYEDIQDFVKAEMDWFLEGYSRCLIQGQEVYLEIWIEKDALFNIFNDVARSYCVRTVVCRGYQSVTFIADFHQRAEKAMNMCLRPIVLYFGDLDPSGVQMLEATIETLENEMGLYGVEFKRVALNPDQVDAFNLLHNPKALKFKDPRYSNYVRQYGHIAVELDAIDPPDLSQMIRDQITNLIDVDLFAEQQEIEQGEMKRVEKITELKPRIRQMVEGVMFD